MESCKNSGSRVLSALLETPIGHLRLSACDQGIHSIRLPNHLSKKEGEQFVPQLTASLTPTYLFNEDFIGDDENDSSGQNSKSKPIQIHLNQCVQWLQTYFKNPKLIQTQEVPKLCLSNYTAFETQVWTTLLAKTGLGETTSYSKLADAIDNPKAARAVGTAMKNNPIVLIIPCHRVIRADGSLGNYSGGFWNAVKEYLINHEKQCNSNQ